MGNICSTSPVSANDVTKKVIDNDTNLIIKEFMAFQVAYCELGEEYFMSFNELCAALFTYMTARYNISEIISTTKRLIDLDPKLKHSGFKTNFNNLTYSYVVGMRLKKFPERPLPYPFGKVTTI